MRNLFRSDLMVLMGTVNFDRGASDWTPLRLAHSHVGPGHGLCMSGQTRPDGFAMQQSTPSRGGLNTRFLQPATIVVREQRRKDRV